MNIFMNIFNEYFHVNPFIPILHQTHCYNFRLTEILEVISGDFCRTFFSGLGRLGIRVNIGFNCI